MRHIWVLLLLFSALGASPACAAVLSDVQHVVIILKENHTFDNYFGSFPGADGATTGRHDGTAVPLAAAPLVPTWDLPHMRNAALSAWDAGEMDNFTYPLAYSEYFESEIPTYWSYARRYVLADRFFTSVMGPSFPNHLFTIFGTSFNAVNNPFDSNHQRSDEWGCDSAPSVTVQMADGSYSQPCWDVPTLIDEMDGAGVSWKYYGALSGQGGYVWTEMDAIRHLRYGPDWNNVVSWRQFIGDARQGSLPAVSWVTTEPRLTEHPPADVSAGEAWTAGLISAIQNGPDGASTVIFVSWDDFGGWYDHVAPPQVDDTGYGFRVPLLIISPFAKRGYVFHGESDFASLPKFIEGLFGLAPMGPRDAQAGDLLGAFNFSQ